MCINIEMTINMNCEVIMMIMSPVGAWQDDASQSGQGREVETEAHLEHDEGDEADLSLEGADTGLVRRDAGHQVTHQVE